MHGPTVALCLVLMLVPFAGCIGDDEAVTETGVDVPLDADVPDRVQRFLADGSPVPIEDPTDIPGAVYSLTGYQGAEPTMGVTSSGTVFVAAFEYIIRSTDGGSTWDTAYDFAVEEAPQDPFFNADPMMWVDTVTDTVYDAPMYPALTCTTLIASNDDGETWQEHSLACPAIQPLDRQTLSSGLPGPDAPPQAGVAHPTVLYICYNQLLSTSCMMSYDGGRTWPVNRPVWDAATAPPGSEGCAGQNGHPTAAPDGTIVVPKSWHCEGLFVAVSTDNGLTWDVRAGPQVGGDTLSPEIAFTDDGTMFALWQGDDHRPYMARSTDLGVSWDGPWVVSPPDVESTVFVAMDAGTPGRVAMGFLGTRDTDEYPADAPDDTHWHLYVVTTEDAAAETPTFTAHQVTPDEDPVQVGPVWIGGGGDPSRNMLDFIDGHAGPDGTFYVAYTEGCTEDCAGNDEATPDDSRDRQAAVAWLDGWSLFGPN